MTPDEAIRVIEAHAIAILKEVPEPLRRLTGRKAAGRVAIAGGEQRSESGMLRIAADELTPVEVPVRKDPRKDDP